MRLAQLSPMCGASSQNGAIKGSLYHLHVLGGSLAGDTHRSLLRLLLTLVQFKTQQTISALYAFLSTPKTGRGSSVSREGMCKEGNGCVDLFSCLRGKRSAFQIKGTCRLSNIGVQFTDKSYSLNLHKGTVNQSNCTSFLLLYCNLPSQVINLCNSLHMQITQCSVWWNGGKERHTEKGKREPCFWLLASSQDPSLRALRP